MICRLYNELWKQSVWIVTDPAGTPVIFCLQESLLSPDCPAPGRSRRSDWHL